MLTDRGRRDPYFDNVKGLLILLVVLGHLLDEYRATSIGLDYLYHVIYAFHMPLFVYVSGYFSKNVEKSARTAYSSLIVPAIPFELAYFALHAVTRADNAQPFLTPIFAYWYVFALFGYRVLLPCLLTVRGLLPISIVLALAVGFNAQIGEYMTLSRFLCLLPFFYAGYRTDDRKMAWIRGHKTEGIIVGILAAAGLLILLMVGIPLSDFKLSSPYTDVTGLMSRAIQYIVSVPLSFLLLSVTPSQESALTHVGKRSLQVYFLHFYGVVLIERILPSSISSPIIALALLLSSLGIVIAFSCVPVCKFYDLLCSVLRRLLLVDDEAKRRLDAK